mgnify:CR=1 FL=1
MRLAVVVVGSLLFVTVLHAETASLKMRFVYDGAPPAPEQINVPLAMRPAGAAILNERLLVDPQSRGIRNIVVYVDTGRGRSKLDLPPYDGVKRQMSTANSRFEPHILLARAGDTLELSNRGLNSHNIAIAFFNNPARAFTLPPGKQHTIPLARPEPALMPVDCNNYPWMKAFLVILDHSFAAISDKDGAIVIGDLPANTHLTFKIYHEAGIINNVKINDSPTAWDRSRFELDLSSGVNDIGDILVPADAFLY